MKTMFKVAFAAAVGLSFFACGKEEQSAESQQVRAVKAPVFKTLPWEKVVETKDMIETAGMRCNTHLTLDARNRPSDTELDLPNGVYSRTITAGDNIDSKIPNPFAVQLVNTHKTSCRTVGRTTTGHSIIECSYNPATKAVEPNYVKLRFTTEARRLEVGVGQFQKSWWVVPAEILDRAKVAPASCIVRM